jgi:predicted DCC family thiol-disulfide oxidoreductase YuxK
MLALQAALAAASGAWTPFVAALWLHLFAFDPAWVKPAPPSARERLFYDGTCGLCHRTVRFLLAEDPTGSAFRFAPLDSEAFRKATRALAPGLLPDSLVLEAVDGALLVRSAGAVRALARLGGFWRPLAAALRLVPAPLRDAAYDGVARVRYRLFARPEEACPVVPPHLRARFDL